MRKTLFTIFLSFLFISLFSADLTIYCAAGMMNVFDELIPQFEKKKNIEIDVYYAGSGNIYGKMKFARNCDIFIPGADSYVQRGIKEKMLAAETQTKITQYIPVVLISDNTKFEINSLNDLTQTGLKIAIGDPKAAAIGKISNTLFRINGIYKEVQKNIILKTPTINQLLVYINLNQIDAAILTENWLHSNPQIKHYKIPKDKNNIIAISGAVTEFAKEKKLAKDFLKFITTDHAYESTWQKRGFEKWQK